MAATTFKAVFTTLSGTKRFKRRSFERAKLSFEDVKRWCSATTPSNGCQRLTWRDEENDVIDIFNQDDLEECIRSHTERGLSPIRLTVDLGTTDTSCTTSESTAAITTSVAASIGNSTASTVAVPSTRVTIASASKASPPTQLVRKAALHTTKADAKAADTALVKRPAASASGSLGRRTPRGTAVLIRGLRTRTALNDRNGVVIGTSTTGRVLVRVGTKVFALRPDNLFPVPEHKRCAVKPTTIPGVVPGAAVVLRGLRSRPDLNGASGKVVGLARRNDRVIVCVGAQKIAVKATNVTLAPQQHPAVVPCVLVPLRCFQRCGGV